MNPFDQFALPPSEGVPSQGPRPQFGLAAPIANQEKKPAMMMGTMAGPPPPMQQQQQQQQPQGMMMPYGQQPFGVGGMMFGAPGQQQQQQQPPPMTMRPGPMMGGQQMPPPPQQQQHHQMMMSMGSNGVPSSSSSSSSSSFAGAIVPSGTQSNPYALGPSSNAASASDDPFGGFGGLGAPIPQQQQRQQSQQQLQQMVQPPPPPPMQMQMQMQTMQQRQQGVDPFGGGFGGAPTAPPQPSSSSSSVPAIASMDPFAPPPPPPPPQQQQELSLDPWGAPQRPPPQMTTMQQSSALVPSTSSSGDPFGIFGGGGGGGFGPSSTSIVPSSSSATATATMADPFASSTYGSGHAPTVAPPSVAPTAGTNVGGTVVDDPWAEMGFGSGSVAQSSSAPAVGGPVPGEDDDLFGSALEPTRDEKSSATTTTTTPARPKREKDDGGGKRKKGELPPGGEWYDAKIFTPTLGVMFFKPKELVDSLFLSTDKKLVDSLDERPVVAFIVEGSSARSAGVELGHVLLKVNGIDVKNPKEASRLIKEGPRPLPLLFYVPETSVVVAEGEHMVKYNTKDIGAPNSAKDWKPKYVVVGGIIAQPWMINMYRSKSEYDIAVIETQARRPVSVKVKQFSLQGARIQNDWQGPQMVKYKNKLHPWKYIVILPVSRNPIKIASPNLSQLKPVHEGIRRVLQAQQRDRGGPGPSAGPVDPYRTGGGGYDARDRNGGGEYPGNANTPAYYGRQSGGQNSGY